MNIYAPNAAEQVAEFREDLRRLARRLMDKEPDEAGIAAMAEIFIDDLWSQVVQTRKQEVARLEDAAKRSRPAAASAPRPPAAGPRHKFGADGTCVAIHGTDGKVCGKAKGRPGRPPAEAPPAASSSVLPGTGLPPGYRAPLGDAAADKFEGGGLGSSGVRR